MVSDETRAGGQASEPFTLSFLFSSWFFSSFSVRVTEQSSLPPSSRSLLHLFLYPPLTLAYHHPSPNSPSSVPLSSARSQHPPRLPVPLDPPHLLHRPRRRIGPLARPFLDEPARQGSDDDEGGRRGRRRGGRGGRSGNRGKGGGESGDQDGQYRDSGVVVEATTRGRSHGSVSASRSAESLSWAYTHIGHGRKMETGTKVANLSPSISSPPPDA